VRASGNLAFSQLFSEHSVQCFMSHYFTPWNEEIMIDYETCRPPLWFLWSEFMVTNPEVRVRFPALPDFLRNSGSCRGSTQPREYNSGAT
jgi:hypothetical protein